MNRYEEYLPRVYEKWLEAQELIYGHIANRDELIAAIPELLTPEECAVYLTFPTYPQDSITPEEARRSAPEALKDKDTYDALVQKLIEKDFLIDRSHKRENTYIQNYLFNTMLDHAGVIPDSPFALASRTWFNNMVEGDGVHVNITGEGRVLANYETLQMSEEISLQKDIPDRRDVVPYDFAVELIRNSRMILLDHCTCRTNKEALGIRECDYPLETCLMFDTLAEQMAALGYGRVISKEEALALTKKCRDMGLINVTSDAKRPSILCSCCTCCCFALKTMLQSHNDLCRPSRFIPRLIKDCTACGQCAAACPAQAISIGEGASKVDSRLCIGCGLCVKNSKGCYEMRLRENAEELLPGREEIDLLLM